MIAKVLASVALVGGFAIGVAAPVMADPNSEPNPFGDFVCNDASSCGNGTLVGSEKKVANPAVDPGQLSQSIQSGVQAVQAKS